MVYGTYWIRIRRIKPMRIQIQVHNTFYQSSSNELRNTGLRRTLLIRDGILGQQFEKRLESFAPRYSQSPGGFLKKTGIKNANTKIRETRKLSLFINSIL